MKKTQRPPTKKEGCFAQLIIAALIVLAILGIRSCFFGETEKEKTFKPTKIEALVHSQLCVERYLKTPGSAEYPFQGEDGIKQINDSTFYVVSYVDAQNSFGALGRIYYECTVIFDKDGNSKCRDMKVEENQ